MSEHKEFRSFQYIKDKDGNSQIDITWVNPRDEFFWSFLIDLDTWKLEYWTLSPNFPSYFSHTQNKQEVIDLIKNITGHDITITLNQLLIKEKHEPCYDSSLYVSD